MLPLTLSLCLGGLMADAPRSATLLAPAEHAALTARLEELKASPAPSLAIPIILLGGAIGSVAISGGMFFVAGFTSILVGGGSVALILVIGVVALVVGAALGIAGGVVLSNTLKARKERSLELRELEQKLQPPEAPAPPSSVQGPAPSLLLATF